MYYGPTAACIITSPNADRWWALHASATPAPGSKIFKVYPFLTGVTVTIDRQLTSVLQVTIDAPFEEGIAMLSEDAGGASPFNTNNLIKVRIGYSDMNLWTPWYYGQLANGGDGLTIGPEGVSGTVSAKMNNWQMSYISLNTPQVNNAREFLQVIADGMGMTLEVGPQALVILSRETDIGKGLTWLSFTKTNMEVLQSLCAKRGLVCTSVFKDDGAPDVLKVYAAAEIANGAAMAGKKRNMYVMRGQFSPQTQQYPILSWGPDESLANWFGSTARGSNAGLSMAGINKFTGNPVALDVMPYDEPVPLAGGKVTAKGAAQDRSSGEKKLDVKASAQMKPDLATAPVNEASDAQATEDLKQQGTSKMTDGNQAAQATLRTIGVPDQDVLELIEVRGLCPRFDGPYEVWTVTHTFTPGSYEMEMKVQRTGTLASDEPVQQGTVGGTVPPNPY
jgi:hypothetical protein